MIEIKEPNGVITIWSNANSSEISVTKFRKLLKIASQYPNDFEAIRAEMLEMLEREREETEKERERKDVFKSTEKQIERDLKKIEKLRGIVEQWDT